MEKENWIENVLNSTNGIIKIVPNELLLFKIEQKIKAQKIISNQWIFAAAAVLLILFAVNFEILFSKTSKSNDTEMLASSIFKTNQFY